MSESSITTEVLKSFSFYSDVCRDRNYMEVSYCYRMPYIYHEGGDGSSKTISDYFEDLSHLKNFEIKNFLDALNNLMDINNLSDNPSPRHHRVVNKCRSFFDAYKPQLDRLKRSLLAEENEEDANQPPNRVN